MIFKFDNFINELRSNPKKKEKVSKYESYYGPIEPDLDKQIWYVDYIKKFLPYYEAVNCPPEVENDFDWQLMFALIAGSFSSKIELVKANKLIYDANQKVDVFINVETKERTVRKSISELWGFQILRNYEIYCEEQMNLQILIAEGEKDMSAIYRQRLRKLEFIQNYDQNFLDIKNKNQKNKSLIYHYTSFDTIYNILKSKNLRACDLRKLNDKNEHKIWFDIFDQVYLNVINKEDSKDYLEFIDILKEKVNNYKKYECYVTCLTNERDLLSQWRAYGDDGKGICIGFNISKLLSDLYKNNDENNEFRLLHGHLEYDYSKVYKDVYTKILDLVRDFNISGLTCLEYLNQVDKVKLIDSECQRIFMRLQDLKESSFFEEKEYRLFWMENADAKLKEVKSFQRNRAYVPFVELFFGNELLPIEEIIIGPSILDKSYALENVTDALKHNGYDVSQIKLSNSKIPYRSNAS